MEIRAGCCMLLHALLISRTLHLDTLLFQAGGVCHGVSVAARQRILPESGKNIPCTRPGMRLSVQKADPSFEALHEIDFPTDPELRLIFRRLQNQAWVDDTYFDRIYPETLQNKSRLHWTPIPVVTRAVELLTENRPSARILDLGSGVGKFCLAGAMLSRARFHGIEQRAHFVDLSRRLITHYQIPRVTFFHGNLYDVDWSRYDGVYLFNPFQENKTPYQRIDSSIELGLNHFDRYVQFTHRELSRMPAGFRVVTYHGFGGRIPDSYRLLVREFCHRGPLECWEKTR